MNLCVSVSPCVPYAFYLFSFCFLVLSYSSLVVFVLLLLFRDLLVFQRETESVYMGEGCGEGLRGI